MSLRTGVPHPRAILGGLVVIFVSSGALSCAHAPTHTVRIARFTTARQPEAGFTPTEQQQLESNCGPFGIPQKSADFAFGPTHFVVREGYALEHLSTDKIPLWVCEGVTQDQLHGNAKRRDKFNPDPKLPVGQRAELSDYKGSGFDRGHQAPAGDQVKSQQRKDETFLLSNMAPQVGPFNQQIWAALEDMVRLWVENGNATDVHILTSGIFYDPAEDNPTTADGLIPFDAIGNGVAVPTHFYKIVLGKKAGQFEAIAFVMENKKVAKPYDFTKYIKSIDWVEERAGLDFFPELAPGEEQRLERMASPLW